MENEENLHFIWKYGWYFCKPLKTTCGANLELICPGEENFDAGPDFFNARIKLDDMVWAGNVEIHPVASDWNKHGHQFDPAYDNVILHVVHHCDLHITNSKGRLIPSLVMEWSESLLASVEEARKKEGRIPCSRYINNVPERILKPWLNKLYTERLELKATHISRLLSKHRNERGQVLYLAIASGFGLPINSLPFEMLASDIPLQLLLEIRDSPNDLEALLFGYSGLLQSTKDDEGYIHSLMQRYSLLKKELPEKPVPEYLWKFYRIRPASFPTLRISQFASLIHTQFPMEADFLREGSISEIENKLKVSASEYWNTHYTFGRSSPFSIKRFGKQAVHHLIINAFLPFLETQKITDSGNKGLTPERELMHNLEAESNYITKNWTEFGVRPCNAFESQALIQLHKCYCNKKRCFDCQIGRELLRAPVHEK